MRPCTSPLTVIALIICMALPAWGKQYLLYVPQPVTSSQNTSSQNGILVQEIEVRKGDTLYGLSRKFNGRGMYFPQILLFNSIKNPNLIHTGDTLRVPVAKQETNSSGRTDTKPAEASRKTGSSGSRKAVVKSESQPAATITASPTSTPGTDLSLSDLKRAGTRKTRTACQKSKSVHKKKKSLAHSPPAATAPLSAKAAAAAPTAEDASGRMLFESAVKAYRKDDCRTALELLDRYLAANSGSQLAADANLYKAECYLKLSTQ